MRRFLGVERPLRKGKRFYFSIQEKPSTQEAEAFGIFGNAYPLPARQPYTIAVYGNHRNGGTFLTLLRGDSSLSSAARSIAMHQPSTTAAVTEALIRRGVIVVPATGNATYMLRR
jgi:hypothetical protein